MTLQTKTLDNFKSYEVSKQIVSSHTAENAAQSIMDAIRIAQKHCKR